MPEPGSKLNITDTTKVHCSVFGKQSITVTQNQPDLQNDVSSIPILPLTVINTPTQLLTCFGIS